jgi:hypothetical protein
MILSRPHDQENPPSYIEHSESHMHPNPASSSKNVVSQIHSFRRSECRHKEKNESTKKLVRRMRRA